MGDGVFGIAVGGTLLVAVTVGFLFFVVDLLVDWKDQSGLWVLGAAVVMVLFFTLVPYGWKYLRSTLFGHPFFEEGASRLTGDDYFALAKYRFWGGIVGCVGAFCARSYFGSRRR